MRRRLTIAWCVSSLGLGGLAGSPVTFTTTTVADALLATGSSNNPAGSDLTGLNFGGAGTLVIAPSSSVKGECQSVIRFNVTEATNHFNASFGTNLWTITAVALELTSNYGDGGVQPNNPFFSIISGGQFIIAWLADDNWLEGTGNPNLPTTDGVTYDSLPDLLASPREILATNTYVPPGVNVPVTWPLPLNSNLVADVVSGAEVSFHFQADDDQINYLFNSRSYGRGNEPLLHITAGATLRLVSGQFTNGVFRLTGRGAANTPYHVQATSILPATNWATVGIVSADNAGMIEFDDIAAAGLRQRYYRLVGE